VGATGLRQPSRSASGGRTWWTHFEFTPINIEPIILKNKIEDLREAGASSGEAPVPIRAERARLVGAR